MIYGSPFYRNLTSSENFTDRLQCIIYSAVSMLMPRKCGPSSSSMKVNLEYEGVTIRQSWTSLWTSIGSATLRPERQKSKNSLHATWHILGTPPCQSPSRSRLSSLISGSESLQTGRPRQNKSSTLSGSPRESNAKVYSGTTI
jgi:hypothetical protein